MKIFKWSCGGLIATVILIALTEFGLRLYYYGSLTPFAGGARLYKPDPQLAFIPNPGVQSSIQRISYIVPVNINSLGMRGPELAPKKGRFRIAVTGDGHIFGSGLTDQETLPAQLGQALNKHSGSAGFDVVNASGPSYNTLQQLLRLRTLLPILEADLVILAFNSENDIQYNFGPLRKFMTANPRRPTARLGSSGEIEFDFSAPQKHFARRKHRLRDLKAPLPWYINTAIYVRGRVLWRSLGVPLAGDPNLYLGLPHLASFSAAHSPHGLAATAYEELWREGWSLTKALILEMKAEAARHGAKLAITVLPSDVQVDRKFLENIRSGHPGLELDMTRINRLIGEFGADENIPVLETLKPLLAARDAGETGLHYKVFDSHMTPKSHRIMANALAEQLSARGLVSQD